MCEYGLCCAEAAVIGQFRLNHHSHFVGRFVVFGNLAVRVQTDVVETILLHNPQMPGVLFSRRGRTHRNRIRVIVAATAQKVSHVVQIQVAAADFVFLHAETLDPAIDRAFSPASAPIRPCREKDFRETTVGRDPNSRPRSTRSLHRPTDTAAVASPAERLSATVATLTCSV